MTTPLLGNIPYTAEFDDHAGNLSTAFGTTAMLPEPISSILFLSGGVILAGRTYVKKRKQKGL